jgi:hypothetical protein
VFITHTNPQLPNPTALAKETSGLINCTETSDEIITMWQGEARGYKTVNPELPHLSAEGCV